MKVAVSSQGSELTAAVDSRFGRCAYFILVGPEKGQVESISNKPDDNGAGVAAAQLLAGKGVEAVITGNLGPKATRALAAAGISAYQFTGGTVEEALNALEAGELKPFI